MSGKSADYSLSGKLYLGHFFITNSIVYMPMFRSLAIPGKSADYSMSGKLYLGHFYRKFYRRHAHVSLSRPSWQIS
jgi:hypothetical protein